MRNLAHLERPGAERALEGGFRLWDLPSGQLPIAQQYGFGPEGPRENPHLIAAAIIERYGR